MNPKRSFQTLVNNKPIWEYEITSKYTVNSSPISELESARIYCGLSIDEFDRLTGTQYWATEETSVGIYDCKADVLVFYRSQKLTEAIINDLNNKDLNKK